MCSKEKIYRSRLEATLSLVAHNQLCFLLFYAFIIQPIYKPLKLCYPLDLNLPLIFKQKEFPPIFQESRYENSPYFEIVNFPPNFQANKIPPIFQESRYENSSYFEIVNFPPNLQGDKIPFILKSWIFSLIFEEIKSPLFFKSLNMKIPPILKSWIFPLIFKEIKFTLLFKS